METLQKYNELTCAQIVDKIYPEILFIEERNQANASISSILKKMKDKKILDYGPNKGPRGGSTYCLVVPKAVSL